MKEQGRPIDASEDPPPKVTRQIAAEAAAWVARLHGPGRNRDMELQCLQWQQRSAAHRHAFERCTEVWLEVPNAALAAGYVPTPRPGADGAGRGTDGRRKLKLAGVAASCVLVVASIVVLVLPQHGAEYRTAVGEAQTVVLQDGTRMSLNTDTLVRVEFGARQRTVDIDSGEVAFEVAKDATRPFVVRAAASEVVALGTAFSVRFTPSRGEAGASLAVTLIEGSVSLRPAAGVDARAMAPVQALVMQPGERVRLAKAPGRDVVTRQELDHPRLDQVTAWKRNEAVFDRTTLREAVAEMNRYSSTPLVLVGDLARADWLVSGQYRTGDNAGFANALAALHGLVVRERDGRLELSQGS